ncbi:MAG: T9SS type A sorting domain-containing protein [Bacteroidetes bacterium]|nr:T9SS type A sorting domain-containing protein [Bacteroidota bacterium]
MKKFNNKNKTNHLQVAERRANKMKNKFYTMLIIAFLSVTFCTTLFSQPPPGAVLIWSADFETGDQSQFHNLENTDLCDNGVIGVSSTIVHSGNYAGKYSGDMPSGAIKCREYWNVNFKTGHPANTGTWLSMTDFYWEAWFYIPTVSWPTGPTAWFSPVTIGTITNNWATPLTLGSGSNRLINLFSHQTQTQFNQNNPTVPFPFDQWFKLSMIAHNFGPSNADVTLYQDNVAIIHATGNLSAGGNDSDHFGLYIGSGIPNFTVYNDDISVYSIPTATATNEYPNSNAQVFVYFDPSTDYVNVTLSGINFSSGELEFAIYDLCGRTVKKIACNSSSLIVNRSDVSNGMYLYQLKDTEKIIGTGKIIIQN